jgi:hypothetical protein
MLNVRVTTVRKARLSLEDEKTKSRKRRKKSPIMLEYETYLMNLERGKALEMTLKEQDKFQTIRYRLNAAAKSLRIKNLRIHRAGDKVVCYREVQPRRQRESGRPQRPPAKLRKPTVAVAAELPANEAVPEVDMIPDPVSEPASEPLPAGTPALTQDETAPPAQGQEGPVYFDELEFDEECEMPMVYGIKTCETRASRYAHETFEAFGHQYVITAVEQLPLGEVQQKWFKQHGLFSPKEFKEVWRQRNKGEFDPEQKVWVHQFKRGFAPPPEPVEEYDVGDAEPAPTPHVEID